MGIEFETRVVVVGSSYNENDKFIDGEDETGLSENCCGGCVI
jgi:hypothetical protein